MAAPQISTWRIDNVGDGAVWAGTAFMPSILSENPNAIRQAGRRRRALLNNAHGMGIPRLYFGTDGPAFCARLAAEVHEPVRADFWFVRFDLAGSADGRLFSELPVYWRPSRCDN
jgi:hypothetical protein